MKVQKNDIDELLKEFDNSIENLEDKNELSIKFKEYIYELKKIVKKTAKIIDTSDENSVNLLLKYSTEDIIKLSPEQKRQMLIKDESFEKIRSISNNAFEMAQEAYTSEGDNIDETKVDEMQKKLNELLKSVKAFNKQQAIWLVSEGILDLNFVKNPKTDIMSIRLGRCLQRK